VLLSSCLGVKREVGKVGDSCLLFFFRVNLLFCSCSKLRSGLRILSVQCLKSSRFCVSKEDSKIKDLIQGCDQSL
jgi:hypothetical protein